MPDHIALYYHYTIPSSITQFIKFALIGALNTGVDFGILNTLSYFTGVYAGARLIPLNAVSFVIALVNSYALNKYWTFRAAGQGVSGVEFGKFLAISLVGLAINTGALVLVTSFFAPPFGFSIQLWENFAKAAATGVSLIWNFAGYKYIVFRKIVSA